MLVVKVWKEEDKPLYNIKWDMGCMVQDLTPFLRAIGKSRFLETTWLGFFWVESKIHGSFCKAFTFNSGS